MTAAIAVLIALIPLAVALGLIILSREGLTRARIGISPPEGFTFTTEDRDANGPGGGPGAEPA